MSLLALANCFRRFNPFALSLGLRATIFFLTIFVSLALTEPHFDLEGYRQCRGLPSSGGPRRKRPSHDPHQSFRGDPQQPCSGELFVDRVEVGRGGTATVSSATYAPLGEPVALKILNSAHSGLADNERCFLSCIADDRVPRYYCSFLENGQMVITMQLIQGAPMRLSPEKEPPLESAPHWQQFLAASVDFIHYMHEQGLLLNDFKRSNVLVDTKGHIYFIDFGYVSLREEVTSYGTPLYAAPERLKPTHYNPRHRVSDHYAFASDWYTLGLALFEIFQGRRVPFGGAGNDINACKRRAMTGLAQNELPPGAPGALVGGLVRVDRGQRWCWRQICGWVGANPQYQIPPILSCERMLYRPRL